METSERIVQLGQELGGLVKNYRGRNGMEGELPGYIPLSALKKFWSSARITEVLNENNRASILTHETISKHSLRVLSLLLFLGQVSCLETFISAGLIDKSFPINALPLNLVVRQSGGELLDQIKKWQWTFFPVVFNPIDLNGQTLSSQHILPICEQFLIRSGQSVTVSKIHTSLAHDTFVLKTYQDDSFNDYKREQSAFQNVRAHPSQHIIMNYGSFTQEGSDGTVTHNLILEYANGGSLNQFYERAHPPRTKEDLGKFWGSFIGLFEALFYLHLVPSDSQSRTYRVIHQNIRPENILVCRHPSGQDFDIILKIADFGHSHTEQVDRDYSDPYVMDLHPGQTYGATECSHHARYTQYGQNRITTAADIFSMGCVLSDAASWVFNGIQGRSDYEHERITETTSISSFNGSGRQGCFHDGIGALKAVGKMHRRIMSCSNFVDPITPRILEVVQRHMLVQQAEMRWTARELYSELSKIVQDISELPAPMYRFNEQPYTESYIETEQSENAATGSQLIPSRTQSTYVSPVSSPISRELTRRSGTSDRLYNPVQIAQSKPVRLSYPIETTIPMLSLEQAEAYCKAIKSKIPPDNRVEQVISRLTSNLRDRDHVFFLDLSETMRIHQGEVFRFFPVIAYISKLIDTDGIEVFLSSDPDKGRRGTSTTKLLDYIKKQRWDQIAFEDKFGKFIDGVIIPRLSSRASKFIPRRKRKSLNVLVFTDGRWSKNKGKAGGIENPIRRVIQEIQRREISRTRVAIQFVRFGDDENGMNFLSYLDNFGKQFNCDIVDSKPANGNIYEMLVGAIDPDIDCVDETSTLLRSNSLSPPPTINDTSTWNE